MPVPAPTVLTSGALSAANVTTTTASVSPATTEACEVVWVWAQKSTGGLTDTSVVAGNGRTWVKVQSQATGNFVASLWVGYGGTPTTGTITITHNAIPTSGRYVVVQQTQVDPSVNPINASWKNNATGTTGAVTIATCANMLHSYWGHNATEQTNPKAFSTWAEFHDAGAAAMNVEAQYVLGGDGDAAATWPTSSVWGGCVVEFKKYTLNADGVDEEPADITSGTAVLFEGDEEGPATAGKPSGVWAIVGGNE